jgi:alpha-L-fucosidase
MAGFSDAGFAGDFGTPEQEIPAQGIPGVDWESCMTMNNNWGFNELDKNFKSTTRIIHDLVDIVSKGGNYLLNIGPKADGTFPDESIQRLKEIGQWMRVNGESIYGSHASPFKWLPWGRATMKPGKNSEIYLQVFDWPADGKLVVPGLGNDPVEAHVLGSQVLSSVTRRGADLVVSLPKEMPNRHVGVVKLTVKGSPIVYETPVIGGDSDMLVDTLNVRIDSGSKDLEVRYTTNGSAPSSQTSLYKGPFKITGTTTVKAQSFHKGKPVSAIAAKKFQAVEPWAATVVDAHRPGLQRQVFKGDWNRVPNFATLKAESTLNGAEVGLGEYKSMEFVGLQFTGWIQVPSKGVYAFSLLSDDGANLWIDGKLAVDHDGLHSPSEKVGFVPLAKGLHKIRVDYFNKSGGAALGLKWAKVGSKLNDVAMKSLWH